MQIEPLGDSAALLRNLTAPAHRLVPSLEKLPGVSEAVASYETVGVFFEPGASALKDLAAWLSYHEAFFLVADAAPVKTHLVPVCYELGEDLAAVSASLELRPDQVIQEHVAVEYDCFAVGFVPGFPYLGYLSNPITGLPRRKEPRVSVPKGSVAITGRQTGIYPASVPGGWNLIARTPLEIVNLDEVYFPISAGDKVRFQRIDEKEFGKLEGERL